MNTEVNYVIAKLLKEKGFDLPTKGFYYSEEFKTEDIKFSDNINHNSHISKFSSPTITQAIMWLYEKYGIWIEVIKFIDHASDVNDGHTFKSNYTFNKEFSSPTEAYLEAITHVLTNLNK
jgi:hypothetical protein